MRKIFLFLFLAVLLGSCDSSQASDPLVINNARFGSTSNRIIIFDREMNERVRLFRNDFTERVLNHASNLEAAGGRLRVDDYADGWLDAMAYIYVEGEPAEVLVDSTR